MALHFSPEEFSIRGARLKAQMDERELDAMLLFAPESMYWLTGYDTLGYCFFQCLIITADGRRVLLTRPTDKRQAEHTSNLEDIRVWIDRTASPVSQLKDLLFEMELLGCRLGIEYDTPGLTGAYGRDIDNTLQSFADLIDESELMPELRKIKSPEEIEHIRKAATLADAARTAGLAEIRPGADEGTVLAAMQSAVLKAGGDYAGCNFLVNSGEDAVLSRAKSGRRTLLANDQVTLYFSSAWRHYHVAQLETVIVGTPTPRHLALYEAAHSSFSAMEKQLLPGHTFGDIYTAYSSELDARNLMRFRLNSCGFSLGAHFAPSWFDMPLAQHSATDVIEPNMVLFIHVFLADSGTGTAMTLGRTYLTTVEEPECLSALPLDLAVKAG